MHCFQMHNILKTTQQQNYIVTLFYIMSENKQCILELDPQRLVLLKKKKKKNQTSVGRNV